MLRGYCTLRACKILHSQKTKNPARVVPHFIFIKLAIQYVALSNCMQLAGAICGICRKNVLLDSDATWCARCKSVLHRDCLTQGNHICPTCTQKYERPESRFVFSKMCPECFRPNIPPVARCSKCSASTRWDTQQVYEDFLDDMKDTSRVYVLRGLAELIGAIACLTAFVGLLFFFKIIWLLMLTLLAFMTLTADGFVSLTKSRKIAKFR
jgi:hypothetical protein